MVFAPTSHIFYPIGVVGITLFYRGLLTEAEHMRKNCEYIPGAYDRCLDCKYLGNGCDGPRTTSMSNERWLWWVKALKQLRGYSNQQCVEGTGLAKSTIDNIFAGNNKDLKRSTAGILEDFLIGSSGAWPCAMDLNEEKDVVYMDTPETHAMLQERGIQVENLRRHLDEFKTIMDKEVATVRSEYEDDVAFFKEQIVFYKDQIHRKDEYIDYLVKKNSGDAK